MNINFGFKSFKQSPLETANKLNTELNVSFPSYNYYQIIGNFIIGL